MNACCAKINFSDWILSDLLTTCFEIKKKYFTVKEKIRYLLIDVVPVRYLTFGGLARVILIL